MNYFSDAACIFLVAAQFMHGFLDVFRETNSISSSDSCFNTVSICQNQICLEIDSELLAHYLLINYIFSDDYFKRNLMFNVIVGDITAILSLIKTCRD